MPITINGTGTVTGISAGGLPDGCITTADLDSSVPVAKAWVNFNGTSTVAIRASYNVSSITDNGVGDYTVTFTTALTDANYAASISQNPDWGVRHTFAAAINTNGTSFLEAAPASNAFRFYIAAANTAAFDPKYVNVAVFR